MSAATNQKHPVLMVRKASNKLGKWQSQIKGSMNEVKSVRRVMEELAEGYVDTMARLDEIANV